MNKQELLATWLQALGVFFLVLSAVKVVLILFSLFMVAPLNSSAGSELTYGNLMLDQYAESIFGQQLAELIMMVVATVVLLKYPVKLARRLVSNADSSRISKIERLQVVEMAVITIGIFELIGALRFVLVILLGTLTGYGEVRWYEGVVTLFYFGFVYVLLRKYQPISIWIDNKLLPKKST